VLAVRKTARSLIQKLKRCTLGNKKKAEYLVSLIEKLLKRAAIFKGFIGADAWNVAQEAHRQAQDLAASLPDD